MSYQKVIIVGNLGRDPEMRYTPDGTPVTSFSVATNRRWTNSDGSPGEETAWFRVSVWRKPAENAAKYLTKGRQVMVEGRMTPDRTTGGPRVWTGSDGSPRASYEMTADRIIYLSGRTEASGAGDGGDDMNGNFVAEDDIPF
ncbi:MAG: single-stranded DNA-binding protein [Anaerolineae bacterium]|nr:single-stranded DNA-binding protein [Anaerolineae bacterium]